MFPLKGSPVVVKKVEWVLRIALCGEFLGHGVYAFRAAPHFQDLITGSLGISRPTAASILPVIGVVDFAIAALALAKPIRAVLLYAAVWGLLTGLARPLSGREIWDFVEHSPNWGVPLALLYIRGVPTRWKDWLR